MKAQPVSSISRDLDTPTYKLIGILPQVSNYPPPFQPLGILLGVYAFYTNLDEFLKKGIDSKALVLLAVSFYL